VSAQADAGISEEPDLSNLSLSRKEGFLLFAETPPREQPELLSLKQVKALSEEARADRARRLRLWHANLGPFQTPQLAELHEDLWDILDSNVQDGDKVKGAVAIDAFPGLGKTTAVMSFARKFHQREIAEHGRSTPAGNERLPVCRVGLTGNTGMKDFNRAMLEFYGHPGSKRGTTAQMAHRALDCILSCHCRLLVIDFTDLALICTRRPPGPLPGPSRTALPTMPLTFATCAPDWGKLACGACQSPTSPRCALDLDVTDMYATLNPRPDPEFQLMRSVKSTTCTFCAGGKPTASRCPTTSSTSPTSFP
jgi:hypothetical protein